MLTFKVFKISMMQASFKFRLGAIHALKPVSENVVKQITAPLHRRTVKPLYTGKAMYLLG